MEKGLIFYLDAILAVVLVLSIVAGIGIYFTIEPELEYRTIHTEAEDFMQLLSQDVEASELGLPENYTGKTYLETIGTLWLNGNTTEAEQAADYLLGQYDMRCIELLFGDEVVYKNKPSCDDSRESVVVANRMASGYTAGKKPDGYMARVILNRLKRIATKYTYFGGYVGDGNITRTIELENLNNTIEAMMELNSGSEFQLYINGNYSGDYTPTAGNMSSDYFVICNSTYQTSYCSNFQENNTLDFIFTGNRSYIGGGYIKIRYNTTRYVPDDSGDRYQFPGIDGIINLYSSFYVPGQIQEINAFLHYTSNYTIFMNFGNSTIYTGSTPKNQKINVTINSSEINSALVSDGLDFPYLSNKTIPLRLGMQNVSYVTIGYDAADVFSVTDLSGSMDDNCGWWCSDLTCDDSSCGDSDGCKMCDAKIANYDLIDTILNQSLNRVGLVGYETSAKDSDFHRLSNESDSLKDLINYTWDADGNTCICCGINKAKENFRYLPENNMKTLGAYYQFDGNVSDISGQGNDGTIYGDPQYVGGVSGNSLDFDGSGDYVRVSDDDSIGNSGLDELTFSMWIYPRYDSGYMCIGGTTDDWNGDGYNFYLRGGRTNYEYAFTMDGNYVRGGNIVTDQWHHLAGTFNGTTMVLYLDGSPLGYNNVGGVNPNDRDLYIGRIRGYSRPYFDGLIDDVRVYSSALNQTEISYLANQTPTCGNNYIEVGEVCDGTSSICETGGGDGISDCEGDCSGFESCVAECGDGVLGNGEDCDDGNTNSSDGCSEFCQFEEEWYRSMIVMSDGNANVRCSEQGTGNAEDDAIEAACDAYDQLGIEVHAVGFGSGASEDVLRDIADCGHGEYYYADVDEIEEIYELIAAQILNASYEAQTVEVYEGEFGNITLFPDSHINFTFNSSIEDARYGEITVKVESQRFGGVVESPKNGSFIVPSESRAIDAKVTSYSSEYWTDRTNIYNGSRWENVYNLWDYNLEYKNLGDPYAIYLPVEKIREGVNNVSINTGGKMENSTGGSPDSRVIYTLAIDVLTNYTDVFNKSEGSSRDIYYDWDIDGEEDGYITMKIGNYSDAWDPESDAIDNALMKLYNKLNFYNDTGADDGEQSNPIDVYPGELSFDMVPIGEIPWLWGPGIFTMKVW